MEKQKNKNVRRKKEHMRRKAERKKRIRLMTSIGLAVLLFSSIMWLITSEQPSNVTESTTPQNSNNYKKMMVETSYSIPLIRDNNNLFYSLSNGSFYHVTNDKITYRNNNFEVQWEEIYDFVNPSGYIDNDKIIVYEPNSTKNAYVYGSSGYLYSITPKQNIKSAKVNKNGYAVVLTNENDTYRTYVYDNTGELLLSRIDEDEKIVIIDFDISDDNKYLAFSYLDLASMGIKSNILFQYIHEADAIKNNATDGIFSWYTRPDMIIGKVIFVNNSLLTVSDTQIEKFKINKNTVTSDFVIPFNNVVDFIQLVDDKYIVVYMGEPDINKESYPPNTVVVYDLKGKIISETTLEKEALFLRKGIKSFLVNIDNTIINYDINGKEKWRFSNGMSFVDFILLGNNETALAIDSSEAVRIDYRKAEVDNNMDIPDTYKVDDVSNEDIDTDVDTIGNIETNDDTDVDVNTVEDIENDEDVDTDTIEEIEN